MKNIKKFFQTINIVIECMQAPTLYSHSKTTFNL